MEQLFLLLNAERHLRAELFCQAPYRILILSFLINRLKRDTIQERGFLSYVRDEALPWCVSFRMQWQVERMRRKKCSLLIRKQRLQMSTYFIYIQQRRRLYCDTTFLQFTCRTQPPSECTPYFISTLSDLISPWECSRARIKSSALWQRLANCVFCAAAPREQREMLLSDTRRICFLRLLTQMQAEWTRGNLYWAILLFITQQIINKKLIWKGTAF